MRSLYETGEFGGRKEGDIARAPPPNDHGLLLVHHPIENAGQIFTEAGVRRFTRHEAPHLVLYSIPVRKRRSAHSLRHQDVRGVRVCYIERIHVASRFFVSPLSNCFDPQLGLKIIY